MEYVSTYILVFFQQLPYQIRTCNPYLERDLTYCKNVPIDSSNDYWITAIKQYESSLDLGIATPDIVGNYFCAETSEVKAGFVTMIELRVHYLSCKLVN